MTSNLIDHPLDQSFVDEFRKLAANDLIELAYLQSTELTAETLQGLNQVEFPTNFGLQLQREDAESVVLLMRQAVCELSQPTQQQTDELAADFAAIYLLHTYRASPCESVWFDEDGLVYQQPMFDVREVMQHYGLQAEDWRRRSEDHLAMQLLFVAYLLECPSPQLCAQAALRDAAKFLDEHTLRWIGKFSTKIAARCFTKFYAGLVKLTEVYLDQLRDELALVLGEHRPSAEEIEAKFKIARQTAAAAAATQSNCGSLCEPREDPKPNRRRYP